MLHPLSFTYSDIFGASPDNNDFEASRLACWGERHSDLLDKTLSTRYTVTVQRSEIERRSKMEKKNPRERRRARTAQAVLDAAMEIIAERGIQALSIREIAQRIEYSPSGLYEYYASKDEILDALVAQGFAQLTARIERSLRGNTASQHLFEVAQAYMEFARENPSLYLLIFDHVSNPSRLMKTLSELDQNSAYGKLHECIRVGVESGEFIPGADVDQLA